MDKTLNTILNTEIKVNILRHFAGRLEGYRATGREVARQIETTAPSAHAALKSLYDNHILLLEPIGRSHVYSLNRKNRTVKDILLPAFCIENKFNEDMGKFIKSQIEKKKVKSKIVSIIFYGSRQNGTSQKNSDVDIAVVVGSKKDVDIVFDVFVDKISSEFYEFFGLTLDAYVKSKGAFLKLFKNKLPPVATMMDGYELIYGLDILKKAGI